MKHIEKLGISPWPWSADDWSESEHGEHDVRIRDANDNEIAQPLSTFSDASLIAASPELYKALYDVRLFVEWCANDPDNKVLAERAGKHYSEICVALAKAAERRR